MGKRGAASLASLLALAACGGGAGGGDRNRPGDAAGGDDLPAADDRGGDDDDPAGDLPPDGVGPGDDVLRSPLFVGLRREDRAWPGPVWPFAVADDGAGGAWVTDPASRRVRRLDGRGRTVGVIDGTSTGAVPFVSPLGVAVDPATGHVLVSDAAQGVVQGFAADGSLVRAVTGAPGLPLSAPFGLAFDGAGVLYVADAGNDLVRGFAPDGTEVATLGLAPDPLSSPLGVFADAGGIWVADTGANAVRHFGPDGGLRATVDGTGTGATPFRAPASVAVDARGHLRVADTGNSLVQEFDAQGAWAGRIDGPGAGELPLVAPLAVAAGADGSIWVADTGNGRVLRFEASGALAAAGDAGPVRLSGPRGVAVDAAGDPWVVDTGSGLLVQLGPDGAVRALHGGGPGRDALPGPWAAAFAPDGSAWVADTGADTLVRLDPTGVPVLWLDGTEGGGDAFAEPAAVAVDADGNAWVADAGNGRVRRYDAQGVPGPSIDGTGPGATRLQAPHGVAVDLLTGDLYVASTASGIVQRFGPDGAWRSTLDGTAAGAAPFSGPAGLAVDGSGRLFVADSGNDRVAVFDPDGSWLTTLTGYEEGAEPLFAPGGVAVDPAGNVWVADTGNGRVQAFAPRAEAPTRAAGRPEPGPARPGSSAGALVPAHEFQFSGSARYEARQYDPNDLGRFVIRYRGTANWRFTYVFLPEFGVYVSDASRSRIEGTRSKSYTSRAGNGTLCDEPAVLTDTTLLGTQHLAVSGLDGKEARVVLPLPTDLLVGCDTAGPGVIYSAFYPPVGGPIPDFPTRVLPHGWLAKFPTRLLSEGGSQVLWTNGGYRGNARHQRAIGDGTTRIDTHEWTISAQLSGVVPGAYVGLGDSFSAATGAPPLSGPCYRSRQSYVELYDPRTPRNTLFAACSGATTDAIGSAFAGQPAQAAGIPPTADRVSLTVGGNDARLFSVLQVCVLAGAIPLPCSALRPSAGDDARGIGPAVRRALGQVREAAPDARIGILEYPNPFPDGNTTGCAGLRNPDFPILGIRAVDVQFFHDLVATVNAGVEAAAAAEGATFVRTSARFAGHDMCGTPWFGPPRGGPETLHPDPRGNVAMKEALEADLGLPD